MKVALVIGKYHAFGGGAERWTDRHARYLIRQGFDVHLLARDFKDPPAGAICHAVPYRSGMGARLRFGAAIEKIVSEQSFEIVHEMGEGWTCDLFMPHHGTRVAGFEQNVRMLPRLIRPAQVAAHKWLPRYREFAELERRQYSLDRPTRFVAISKMVRDHMRTFFRIPDERIDVVYNGVDVDRFRPGRNRAIRESLGWPDRTIFLLVAHNFRLKGLETLIRSMAKLTKKDKSIGLVVLGSGKQRPFERLAKKLGCEDFVRFVGNQTNPIPYYQASDVYVQPTFYDPCSLVALEALACGLPVITTSMNGAGEILTPGREGNILADPSDVDGLTELMHPYLEPSVRIQAGSAARRLAERFSLDRNSNAIIDLYRKQRAVKQSA